MYSKSEHFRFTSEEDVGIILDMRSGEFLGLNACSVFIWRLFETNKQISAITIRETLVAKYGISAQLAEVSVESFLRRMEKQGAIKPAEKRPKGGREDSGNAHRPGSLETMSSTPTHQVPDMVVPTAMGVFWGFVLLLLMRFLLLCRFSCLYFVIRKFRSELPKAKNVDVIDWAYRCIERASRYLPHHTWCLEKSAALVVFLRMFGVPAAFCIGCRLAPFGAHAWVEVNEVPLNERPDLKDYYVLLDRT